MKGSTTPRKPSTTPTTTSSIATYSAARSRQSDVYDDYSEVGGESIDKTPSSFPFVILVQQQFFSSNYTVVFIFIDALPSFNPFDFFLPYDSDLSRVRVFLRRNFDTKEGVRIEF